LGRFTIWTESAFRKLDSIYGTWTQKSWVKKGFSLPHAKMTNSDFARIIRSDEITKVIRPVRKQTKVAKIHRNPLRKHGLMVKLNPYASVLRRAAILASKKGEEKKNAKFEFFKFFNENIRMGVRSREFFVGPISGGEKVFEYINGDQPLDTL